MNRTLWTLLIFFFMASDLYGQFMVRESFSAASQAAKPASFFWTIEKEPDDVQFGTLDIGVRYAFDWGYLIAGPTAEWHRLTRENQEYDRITFGASGEVPATFVTIPWLGSPYLTGQFSYERNRILEEDGVSWSLAGTFFSNSGWAPGSQNRLWDRSMLRYYPHAGLEHYPAVSAAIEDATLGYIRFNLEFWPWMGRIQALGSYSVVGRVSGENLPDNLNRLSLSLNIYVDPSERVGIGVEYLDSAGAADGFERVRRTLFGLKLKI
jgi:hypothetical protein